MHELQVVLSFKNAVVVFIKADVPIWATRPPAHYGPGLIRCPPSSEDKTSPRFLILTEIQTSCVRSPQLSALAWRFWVASKGYLDADVKWQFLMGMKFFDTLGAHCSWGKKNKLLRFYFPLRLTLEHQYSLREAVFLYHTRISIRSRRNNKSSELVPIYGFDGEHDIQCPHFSQPR